jgi:hypothetical protein
MSKIVVRSSFFLLYPRYKKGKGEDIPVTGRGGPYGYETSKPAHFLNSRLTDGGEVVNLTRRRGMSLGYGRRKRPPDSCWEYVRKAVADS